MSFYCKKCGGHLIVSDGKRINFTSGSDLGKTKDYGKINVFVEIAWCSECGELEFIRSLELIKKEEYDKYQKERKKNKKE